MFPDVPPPDALCERCWSPCQRGERYARLGHIAAVTMRGDPVWTYTYLHAYDPDEGCVRGPSDPPIKET